MRNHEQTGVVVSSIYLLGEIRPIASESFKPFYEYYAVIYALTEPIVLQLLLLAGVISVVRTRDLAGLMRNEWFLPLVFYVVYLSVASRMQMGVRFILPSMALGLILILSAAALRNWTTLTRRTRLTVIAGVVWLSASVLSYSPNSISYANEFVHDRKNAWRLYADSNLAWGQNARLVADFLQRNPDVVLNPAPPGSGRFLVAVNSLKASHQATARSGARGDPVVDGCDGAPGSVAQEERVPRPNERPWPADAVPRQVDTQQSQMRTYWVVAWSEQQNDRREEQSYRRQEPKGQSPTLLAGSFKGAANLLAFFR